tara:strand:+ start:81 stop:569 length:489 start_codon:yes stop_codon:yes gene_type:complete
MSKIATHRSFFGNRYPISINDLQPGMFVEFSYKKTSVGTPETKKYTVMIVDPSYKRVRDKEPFTHAVNLDIASRNVILDIARRTGSTLANSNMLARRIYADKLLTEGQPREFYQSSIADMIKTQGKGSYRTFKTGKIQGLVLIDYIFPDNIEYLDPEEPNEN